MRKKREMMIKMMIKTKIKMKIKMGMKIRKTSKTKMNKVRKEKKSLLHLSQ